RDDLVLHPRPARRGMAHRPVPHPADGPERAPPIRRRGAELQPDVDPVDLPRALWRPPALHGEALHLPLVARHRRTLRPRSALRLLDAERADQSDEPQAAHHLSEVPTKRMRSDVEVHDVERVLLDELTARLDGVAHEDAEQL